MMLMKLFCSKNVFEIHLRFRRGELLYLACQEPACDAKGCLINNPNFDAEKFEIVKIEEHHNHDPAVHV